MYVKVHFTSHWHFLQLFENQKNSVNLCTYCERWHATAELISKITGCNVLKTYSVISFFKVAHHMGVLKNVIALWGCKRNTLQMAYSGWGWTRCRSCYSRGNFQFPTYSEHGPNDPTSEGTGPEHPKHRVAHLIRKPRQQGFGAVWPALCLKQEWRL